MPFLSKRGGNNIAAEVQRWQYFLRRQGIIQAGRIDGQFGLKTETATKFFQVSQGIAQVSGELDTITLSAAKQLGYTARPDDYYDDKRTTSYPRRPKNLRSPTNGDRNNGLGCFLFKQLPLEHRSDKDEIVILGSCDKSISDWRKENIVEVDINKPVFAAGFDGKVTCHRVVAPRIRNLFDRWFELDLLHLIIEYSGSFSPRYKRGQSPGKGGHGEKRSDQVNELSNHAFASAFDINVEDNPFKATPSLCPARGSVRELVQPANDLGFYWGGHFGSPKDGMHFEFADF